jgi:hypothetical protein
MSVARLLYRTNQFWQVLRSTTTPQDYELASSVLTPLQLDLFKQMPGSDQAHSLRVMKALLTQGEQNPDLLVAALLHDVGKSIFPLRLWERILIVLVGSVCPACVQHWGMASARRPQVELGWQRAFVVAVEHPQWGADLAAEAGTSPLAVALIQRHQERLFSLGESDANSEDGLLSKLHAVDNNS